MPPGAASNRVRPRGEAAEAERPSEELLAAELAASRQLQRISTELIREQSVESLHQKIVDAAVALMSSDCASMQLLHPDRGDGELELLAYRGFSPQAARFWEWVRLDSAGSCGMALRAVKRVVVPDVDTCDDMTGTLDRATYSQEGIRAVQSTPLISRSGRLLGMISTHWRRPHDPPAGDLQRLDVLARQAADLLERAQSEAELRRSEQRFRALVEASAQVVWTSSTDGAAAEDSPTWRAFTGQTYEQYRGFGWLDAIHPDDRERVAGAWRAAAAGHTPIVTDYRLRNGHGEWRWTTAHAAPLVDSDGSLTGYVGMNTDVTERRRADEVRREQRGLLERVASGQPLAECLTALTAAVSRLRPGVRAGVLLADEARARIGRSFAADIPASFGQGVLGAPVNDRTLGTCATAMFRGEPITCTDTGRDGGWSSAWRKLCAAHGIAAVRSTPVFGPDGSAVASFLMCFAEPREPDPWEVRIAEFGAHVAAIAIERDRTEQALRANEARLREADRRKDEFLAMLAHELRNPLAPISNASEILSRTLGEDERSRAAVDMLKRQSGHLTRLVDDLLDVSRITRGRIQLQRRPVEIAGILAQAIETVEPRLRAKRHRLPTVAESYEPLYVSGDQVRLVQCLVNLLANAIKYTDAGGEIRVRTRADGASVVVEVSDTGAGIAPELLPRIFDLFVQSDGTLDRAQGGLGIGLSVVRRLVEMHGGEVAARSPGPGRGSSFELRLPRILRPQPDDAETTGAKSPPRRVLIVDDNQDAANSLAVLLGLQGHEVQAVYSAQQALERIESFRPDVALLDLGLPGMNGYQLAGRLRATGQPNSIRLVALTGYGQAEDRQRTGASGFDDHLVKPVSLAALERTLAGLPAGDGR